MFTAENLIAAQQANVETLLGLSSKALDSVEKLAALNLQTTRETLDEVAEATRNAFAAKDPKEWFNVQQPSAEKLTAYSRSLYELFSNAAAEFGKVAESKATESQKQFLAVVDSAVKNAPAGSENVVSLVKSAVAAANNAFEGAQKAAKQAADAAEANFLAVTSSALKSAQVAPKGKRAAAAA